MENLLIPNSWDNVFVDQYTELLKIDPELMILERNMEILTILTDTEYTDEVWEDMDVDDLNDIMLKLKWVSNTPTSNNTKEVGSYKYIDIYSNNFTFGNYLDMDYYISNMGYISLPYLCSIMYRKWYMNKFDKLVYEPYDYKLEDRLPFFNELKITQVFGILTEFVEYKKMITETYSTLFEPTFEEEELEEEELIDPDDIKEKEEEEKHQKWGWENVLHQLSGGDITKYDDITNLPFIFVLNQLSYKKETGRE